MKKNLLVILLCVLFTTAWSQEITTVILIRHAEKMSDGSKDPELTDEGKARAIRFADLLKETKVDAIFSTMVKRTQNTVAPLALSKSLTVMPYQPMKGEVIDEMIKTFAGKTIVICGHSNTTPWTVNKLIGKEEYKDFADTAYSNLMIVTLAGNGKSKVTHLLY
jgi:2,3-bisphosphoglycerate-dependent phosphoglycerate mutase